MSERRKRGRPERRFLEPKEQDEARTSTSLYKTFPYLLQNIFVQNTTEKTPTEEEWTVRPT